MYIIPKHISLLLAAKPTVEELQAKVAAQQKEIELLKADNAWLDKDRKIAYATHQACMGAEAIASPAAAGATTQCPLSAVAIQNLAAIDQKSAATYNRPVDSEQQQQRLDRPYGITRVEMPHPVRCA